MAKPAQSTGKIAQAEFAHVDAQIGQPEPGIDVRAFSVDDFERNVWCVLGLPLDLTDVDGAIAEIDHAVRDNKKLSFVTPNVNWLVRSFRDPAARREILDADLSLVDGVPLVALAKMLSVPVKSRVAGSDLFEALRRRPAFAKGKIKVFFFGGRKGAAQAAMNLINSTNSGLEAVGSCNPGFGDIDSMSAEPVIDQINKTSPDFVVVALGAAKGQAWISRNQDRLSASVVAHLGAVVDFTAGGISRAPKWLQKAGLEWAWRIKEEPALWRRYFADALSLVQITTTKFLPQLRRPAKATSSEVASAEVKHGPTKTTIQLSGDIRHSTLRPIREAFRKSAGLGRDICLDFTAVESFDRAFLGLVLMLEKNLMRSGQNIYIAGVNRSQLRVLNANQMGYPINTAEDQMPEIMPAPHRAVV